MMIGRHDSQGVRHSSVHTMLWLGTSNEIQENSLTTFQIIVLEVVSINNNAINWIFIMLDPVFNFFITLLAYSLPDPHNKHVR